MNKLKIFLDSNVIIAGLASTKGASSQVLRLIEDRVFEAVICQLVIEESQRNFKKKLPRFLPYFYYAIKYLPWIIYPDLAKEDTRLSKLLSKRSDLIIFQTAQKAKPDYFITLDRKHFLKPVIKKEALFKIHTTGQFLRQRFN